MIRPAPPGAELNIRVIPRARKTEVAGFRGDALVVRIAAPPVEGAANDALVAFLADALDVPRRSIRLLSGERGRRKRVAVDGLSLEAVLERLNVSAAEAERRRSDARS